MKKISSVAARATFSVLFLLSGIALLLLTLHPRLLLNRRSMAGRRSATSLIGPGRSTAAGKPARNTVAAPQAAPAPTPAVPVHLGFENFESPGTLINMTSSSQGPAAATVEYLGHDAGEPSIGVNWQSTQDPLKGLTVYQSDLQTLFVKFDDSCPASGSNASWYNSQAPSSQFVDSDPIGFVDPMTGRAFAAQLTLTSPECKISFTDTDGKDPLGNPGPQGWSAPSTGPAGAGIDHQTIGGGPFHAPIPPLPGPYPNAVYYCSQDLVTAFCLRSDDGGATFGPVVPIYTTQCGGLHGHVKVGPDGTVYVPNNDCSGHGAVVVSENNGLTWTIRQVSTTTTGFSDPAVSIDAANRVYFITANGDGKPVVATSVDHGATWQNSFDIGSVLGVNTTAFPTATAGDAGRAAVSFFGSTTAGNGSANGLSGFKGVWHLYVAETFDGGLTWTTVDATPNAPMQRGCIWNGGGADICRNLLDFYDMTVDKQGRVQIGYVDGCAGGACKQAVSDPARYTGNAYTARAVIARQSSGKRLFAANDPVNSTSVPGMPSLTQTRVNNVVRLRWSLADTGNSPVTGYEIWRGTASGTETLWTTVTGTQIGGTYDDIFATDVTKTYYYKVRAVNAVGPSCGNNEVAAPYVGDTCTGLIVQKTPPNHPEQSAQGLAPASLAIDYIAVGEPPSTGNLLFKMKVTSLASVPPSSRWRMVWNTYASSGQQFYVGMRTDSNNVATFEYGRIATQVVGLVLGVPTETKIGDALAGSGFNADGTITIIVPKSAVGSPQPGDLLGAVNGRTFTGDTPETQNLQRSTLLVDHTFVKAQRDNGEPPATYALVGNIACPAATGIAPISAVSRKNHTGVGDFDVNLPLTGTAGIECRTGGTNHDHTVVITFAAPVTVTNASVTPASGKSAALAGTPTVNGSVVTVNLTNVSDAQTLTVNLLGVSDGTNAGDVAIPMSVLLGDTTASGGVNSSDIGEAKSNSGLTTNGSNFRTDVTVNGVINSSDIGTIKAQSGTSLP